MSGGPEQFEPETPGDLNALDGGDDDTATAHDGLDAGDDEAEESDE